MSSFYFDKDRKQIVIPDDPNAPAFILRDDRQLILLEEIRDLLLQILKEKKGDI